MISVKWFAVNYNSDGSAVCFLNSLMQSIIPEEMHVSLEILDNSQCPSPVLKEHSGFSSLNLGITYLHMPSNLGYFGAARLRYEAIQSDINQPNWDWVIVSNVDIEIGGNGLWAALQKNRNREKIGVLAPNIVSSLSGLGQNPHFLTRPSRFRLEIHRIIAMSVIVYNLYFKLSTSLQKVKPFLARRALRKDRKKRGQCSIYAPHGAMIVFHTNFFSKNGNPFKHCSFLFSEEFTVAERIRRSGLEIRYVPDAIILHKEHVSTGLIMGREKVRRLFEARDCIIKKYFRK